MPQLSTFHFRLSTAIALALLIAPRGGTPAQTIDTLAMRAHTRYLASDQLLGRGTATEGERLAATYIVNQLERLGLKPVGDNFLQPIPLYRVFVSPETRITIRRDADSVSFQSGRDFVLAPGARDAYRSFAGEAVLVGTAHQAARVPTTTLRGRVPVVFGSPSEIASLLPAWREAGVGGVILAVPDTGQFEFITHALAANRFFVDADVDDPIWQSRMPAAIIGPALLAALFSKTGLPSSLPDRPISLESSVRADVAIRTEAAPASNVAAVLPGSDPALRNEYVVYTAHYDHLGIGPPDERGDTIYNGFSDNAAGVAMLLAIADALRTSPPARSVAFLFFTGEERGLLGSSFFASKPPIPLDRITAVINLDAGAPPAPPVSWRIAGDSMAIGALARDVARKRGWTAVLSPASPNSDYWPFVKRGINAIFIVPGNEWGNTTTEQRDALRRKWDRYHAASDEWAADFPFSGLARYAEYAFEVGLAAARNVPTRSPAPHRAQPR
jgi:hypothetical protein